MLTCTRVLEFDAGHRIVGHEGKCKNLHGHRYKVEVTCAAMALDKVGRIIDFGKIKDIFGKWIDENLDHNMIFWGDDPFYGNLSETTLVKSLGRLPLFTRHNPTAENLAVMLFTDAAILLRPCGISVRKIKLWETPNCWAEYEGPVLAAGVDGTVGMTQSASPTG